MIGLAGSALLGAGPARAVILQGTGLNGPGNTDTHWEVRASGISGSATAPYSAYIYGLATPPTWAGGGAPQTGYTNADGTFYWIGPNPTTATGENPDSRGWIVRQTLNIAQQGYYSFVLNGYSDKSLRLIFNGTVNQADPLIPVVDGGMAFLKTSGGEPSPFQNLQTFSGIVQLNAGTNTVDLELLDTAPGRHTGVLVTQDDLRGRRGILLDTQAADAIPAAAGRPLRGRRQPDSPAPPGLFWDRNNPPINSSIGGSLTSRSATAKRSSRAATVVVSVERGTSRVAWRP